MFWWCSCTQMNVSTWDFDHQLGCQSVNFQRLSNNICSQIPSKLSEDVDYSTWRRKTYFSTKTLVYTKRTIKGRGWILIFILSAWESCVKSQSSFIFFSPKQSNNSVLPLKAQDVLQQFEVCRLFISSNTELWLW